MAQVVFPPKNVYEPTPMMVDVFLAGSIEMGTAEDWQTKVSNELLELECVRYIFNPRRPDFDSSQKQSIDNKYFSDQVNWELNNIENSTVVFMYFDPNTKSPITLAELGYLLGRQGSFMAYQSAIKPFLVVCCPDGYWRQGNVEIMCERNGIEMHRDLDKAINILKGRVWTKHRILANDRGFGPYQAPFESVRENKLYEGRRGKKLPKNFQME